MTIHFTSLGCGKTMLMDMFFENVQLENKQRIHFNAFMMDVHSRKYLLEKGHETNGYEEKCFY